MKKLKIRDIEFKGGILHKPLIAKIKNHRLPKSVIYEQIRNKIANQYGEKPLTFICEDFEDFEYDDIDDQGLHEELYDAASELKGFIVDELEKRSIILDDIWTIGAEATVAKYLGKNWSSKSYNSDELKRWIRLFDRR